MFSTICDLSHIYNGHFYPTYRFLKNGFLGFLMDQDHPQAMGELNLSSAPVRGIIEKRKPCTGQIVELQKL
jgi:hypothetical protein